MSERDAEQQAALDEFIFRARVPDAALVGLDVNRTQLSFDPDIIDPESGPETDLRWALTGLVTEPDVGSPHLLVIGDLQARRDGWFAGCIVVGHIQFRAPEFRPDAGDQDLIQDYCAWVSSPLYDFAASRVRSLVSSSHGCGIEIAVLTPLADLESLSVGDPHPAGDGIAAELTTTRPPD